MKKTLDIQVTGGADTLTGFLLSLEVDHDISVFLKNVYPQFVLHREYVSLPLWRGTLRVSIGLDWVR